MYKATLRDIEQKCLGADEAHTALLREVSDEHPAGLEGQQPGPHCSLPGEHVFRPPAHEHGGGCGDLPQWWGRTKGLKGISLYIC